MKFAEHLSVHTTPEWRAAYINYEVFNKISIVKVNEFPLNIAKFKLPSKRLSMNFHLLLFFFSLQREFHTNVIIMKIR